MFKPLTRKSYFFVGFFGFFQSVFFYYFLICVKNHKDYDVVLPQTQLRYRQSRDVVSSDVIAIRCGFR